MLSEADKKIIKRLNMKDPAIWLATWFGSGFLSPAPGTWGTLASIPFILLCIYTGGLWTLLAFILITTILGLWATQRFENQSKTHDCKMVVIDEAAGQAIAFIPIVIMAGLSPLLCILAFALFRLFDITKPWPISYVDKHVEGALGVMIDDTIAGIFAAICLTGAIYAGLR